MNIIGSNTIVLNEIHSTNEYASILLSKTKQIDGTIVLTEYQTNGKGQGNNAWVSERSKNLLFSVILYPDFLKIEKQFYLSMAVSLGILKTIEKYSNQQIAVKWPNDVFLNGKKIAGVLIKNTITGTLIKSSVVGIGFNVNQMDFGVTLRDIATSLRAEEKKVFDPEDVLLRLKDNLNEYYEKLLSSKYDEIQEEYESNLYRIREKSRFKITKAGHEDKIITGTILGVDSHGRLRVDIGGKIQTFMHKEIVFL